MPPFKIFKNVSGRFLHKFLGLRLWCYSIQIPFDNFCSFYPPPSSPSSWLSIGLKAWPTSVQNKQHACLQRTARFKKPNEGLWPSKLQAEFGLFPGKMARILKKEGFIRTPPNHYGPSASLSNFIGSKKRQRRCQQGKQIDKQKLKFGRN